MIQKRIFGELLSGETVWAFDLQSEAGYRATILSYGAILQSLIFPDGQDVVLGFDSLEAYLGDHPYFGTAIGRVANRISGAGFELGGKRYALPANEGENNLHSGPDGFDRVNWAGEIAGDKLILRHVSPDGHQGFPGEVSAEYHFTIAENALRIDMRATTTKPTPINLTYHPYFNFGDAEKPIDHHAFWVKADQVLEVDTQGIPTGRILSVAGSRFDYHDAQIERVPEALDHCYVLNNADDAERDAPILVRCGQTGRGMAVFTDQPGCQVYSGEHIPSISGKASYGPRSGIAIEPQDFPDCHNRPEFPDITLRPGETYSRYITYRFFAG